MSDTVTIIAGIVSCLFLILGVVWKHSLWLGNQFASLRELLYVKIDKLEENFLTKLEYHEKHDDSRFQELGKEVWRIKLEQATNGKKKDLHDQ